MKKTILFFLLFSISSYAQTTTNVNVGAYIIAYKGFNNNIIGTGQTTVDVCKGDTLRLSVRFDCVCGSPYWINEKYLCNPNRCEPSATTPQIFSGPNIIEHSTPPAIANCSQTYDLYCKIVPNQTSTYTIEWEKTLEQPQQLPCTQFDKWIYHYSGRIVVNVIEPRTPTIMASKNRVNIGENFTVSTDCNFPSIYNTYNKIVSEQCGQEAIPGYITPSNCPETIYQSFLTGGKKVYKAIQSQKGCLSKPSNPVEVDVRPCGINYFGFSDATLEAQVKEVEQIACDANSQGRSDYHFRIDEKSLCSSSSCPINDIWALYKSKISNQAIIPEDFDNQSSNSIIALHVFNPPYNQNAPITSGTKIDLYDPFFSAIMTGLNNPSTPGGFNPNFKEIEIYNNPIVLHIDETNKCATNYTLPGHSFYPGKVTRCIVEDCGQIKVKTFSEGITKYSQDNPIKEKFGKFIGWLNYTKGRDLFANVDNRFAALVKQRYPQRDLPTPTTGILTNLGIENKNWKLRTFRIKHPNNNELTLFKKNDTGVFEVLNYVQMNFSTTGTYSGMSVKNQAANGTWSTDGISSITIDGATAQISSIRADSFVIKGKMKSFVDTVLVDADYTMVFQTESVLPIEQLSFTAIPLSKTVQINWQTASEKNTSHFEVERSSNGKVFDKIGEVKAYEYSTTLKNYSLLDEKPLKGLNYYRLRGIDLDGTATLSNIIAVSLKSNQRLQVFPNPTKDKLTIISELARNYSIVNFLGREILRGDILDNRIDVNISNLPTGLYFVKTNEESFKFFKN